MNLKLLLATFICVNLNLFSQLNPATNSYEKPVKRIDIAASITKQNNNLAGITCNPNGFFAVDANGNIDEFTLTGSTVTYTTIMANADFMGDEIISLAYGNNLLSSFSKTFYGSTKTNVEPVYFDGSNWANPPPTYSNNIYNCGAYENYVYYSSKASGSLFSKVILKYDGTSLIKIYHSGKPIMPGDLSVDNSGNVWFLTTPDTASFVSDSLLVVSPTGQIIKQFPFSYNMYNSYGSFILNNTFYIGLGAINPVSPNVLLPLSIISNSIVTDSTIPMPANAYYDLASCNAGYPLSVKSNSMKSGFSVYPNPCIDFLELDRGNNEQNINIKIINALGQVVHEETLYDKKNKIDVEKLSSGVYFLQIQNTSAQKTIKFIKE